LCLLPGPGPYVRHKVDNSVTYEWFKGENNPDHFLSGKPRNPQKGEKTLG